MEPIQEPMTNRTRLNGRVAQRSKELQQGTLTGVFDGIRVSFISFWQFIHLGRRNGPIKYYLYRMGEQFSYPFFVTDQTPPVVLFGASQLYL